MVAILVSPDRVHLAATNIKEFYSSTSEVAGLREPDLLLISDSQTLQFLQEQQGNFAGSSPPFWQTDDSGRISTRRNLALSLAMTKPYSWLVFLDDDCRVNPTWSAELKLLMAASEADVVSGPIVTVSISSTGGSRYRVKTLDPSRSRYGQVMFSGNVAIRLDGLRRSGWHEYWFDSGLDNQGGLDIFFSLQAGLRGLVFEHKPRFKVDELAPFSRLALVGRVKRLLRNAQIANTVIQSFGFKRWLVSYKVNARGESNPEAFISLAARLVTGFSVGMAAKLVTTGLYLAGFRTENYGNKIVWRLGNIGSIPSARYHNLGER